MTPCPAVLLHLFLQQLSSIMFLSICLSSCGHQGEYYCGSIPQHPPNHDHNKFSTINLSSHVPDIYTESLSRDSLLIWKTVVGLKAVNINRLISTHCFKFIFNRSESSRTLIIIFILKYFRSFVDLKTFTKKTSWNKQFTTVFIGNDVLFDFISVGTVVMLIEEIG